MFSLVFFASNCELEKDSLVLAFSFGLSSLVDSRYASGETIVGVGIDRCVFHIVC